MIQNVDPDNSTGVDQSSREGEVAVGWLRVAGRVVVKDHHGCGARDGGFAKHVSGHGQRRVKPAFGHHVDPQEPVSGVKENGAKPLDRVRSEPREQKARERPGRSERQSRLRRNQERSSAQLNRSQNPAGLGGADAGDVREAIDAHFRQSVDASNLPEHHARKLERRSACSSVTEDESKQFRISECAHAIARQPLAWSIGRIDDRVCFHSRRLFKLRARVVLRRNTACQRTASAVRDR